MNRLSISSVAFTLVAAAMLIAQPASAFCRAMAKPVAGVCDAHCTGDTLVYWNTRHFKWTMYKDPASSTIQSDLAWNDVQAALQRSTDPWQAVACSDVVFEFAGPSADFKTGYDSSSCSAKNENLIVFREKSCVADGVVPAGSDCLSKGTCGQQYNCWDHDSSPEGPIALTTTTYDKSTGQIVDGDMEFNTSIDPMTSKPVNRFTVGDGSPCVPATDPAQMNCVGTDIANTATHEFGHFLGLAHSQTVTATMFTTAQPGETSKRDLDQDDIDGLCAIYPKGAAAEWCTAPAADPCAPPAAAKKFLGICSATGGVDLLALGMLAAVIRRRRFQRQNL